MTEHNIFHEIESDLERQKYEDLWKRYGIWVIAAAIVAVLGTAGVSTWHSWQISKNQKATMALFDIMEKSTDNPEPNPGRQMGDLEKFALQNPTEAQAVFAQLDAASLAVDAGKTDRAVQLYDEVAKDNAVDPAFRQFAELMSVRTQLDTGDVTQLQKKLEPLLIENAPWRYTAMEYTGFLTMRTGDKEKAHRIFEQLSQDAQVPESLSARAADMLNYLSR